MEKNIIETFSFSAGKIDTSGHVIHDVCLLGNRLSLNNRYYSDKALDSLTALAEGSRSFDGHSESHSLEDLLGSFKNVKRENDSVKGDLYLLESSHKAKMLEEVALKNPALASFSISAKARVGDVDGEGVEEVTDIIKLYSCDCLVVPAGTTLSVFEKQKNEKTYLETINEGLGQRVDELYSEKEQLKEELEKALSDKRFFREAYRNSRLPLSEQRGEEKKCPIALDEARKIMRGARENSYR